MAGSADVFKAAVNAVGGMLAENLEDSLNLARLLTGEEAIKPELLVVTNSGGHGVITTDEAERYSLRLHAIPQSTIDNLSAILPPHVRPRNPLDLSGDSGVERYRAALAQVQDLDCTKLVLVQSMPLLSCTLVANALVGFRGKSLVGVMMGTDEDAAVKVLDLAGIPSFRYPEDAVRAIHYYVARPLPRTKVRASNPPDGVTALISGRRTLTDRDGLALVEKYGIKTPRYGFVATAAEATALSKEIGFPVVMKVSPDAPIHKTEVNGVRLNLAQEEDVISAFAELSRITPRVLIQQQVSGLEVLVGALNDPNFGQTVIVSAGGIYAEVVGTPSHRLAPISRDEAEEMLWESKVSNMLNARNRGYDGGSLIETLIQVSRMVVDIPIKEMDLNPVIVNAQGAFAVDVRTILE